MFNCKVFLHLGLVYFVGVIICTCCCCGRCCIVIPFFCGRHLQLWPTSLLWLYAPVCPQPAQQQYECAMPIPEHDVGRTS